MHGTFSHWTHGRPARNVLTEDAMNFALQAVYPGQPVICSGKPTFVQYVKAGLVFLVGFANPVPISKIEAC
jgi:hypothetical protein